MATFKIGNLTVHAHRQVVDTAKDIAREIYSALMQNNHRYLQWKKTALPMFPDGSPTNQQLEDLFVNECFPSQIETARATLAGLLATPISEDLKSEIHDALVKDAPFAEGRKRARMKAFGLNPVTPGQEIKTNG
jgi:hypothetical protein